MTADDVRISDWISDGCSSDQLVTDALHRLFERRPRRHIVRIGEHADVIEARDLLAGQRIEFDDLLDIVAEERDAPRGIFIMRRENLEIVALHAKIAARERRVVAFDRKSPRLNSRHYCAPRMPSSA